MTTQLTPQAGYAVIVSYPDHSGLIGAYGPFPSDAEAGVAAERLRALPGMSSGLIWEVHPLWPGNFTVYPVFSLAASGEATGSKAKES